MKLKAEARSQWGCRASEKKIFREINQVKYLKPSNGHKFGMSNIKELNAVT
jgi:hypothetical protein